MKKVVGYTAPPEFIRKVNDIAIEHEDRLIVDCTRAYHVGARFNVEMEIVLPARMTVAESHDIALALQHKLEMLDDVERAFVHVDHLTRDGLEHKIERELVLMSVNNQGSNKYTPMITEDGESRTTEPPINEYYAGAIGAVLGLRSRTSSTQRLQLSGISGSTGGIVDERSGTNPLTRTADSEVNKSSGEESDGV